MAGRGVGVRWHIIGDTGRSSCSAEVLPPTAPDSRRRARDVPAEDRCRGTGCRYRWPADLSAVS